MTCVRRTLCLSEKTNRPPLAKRVESPSPTGSCEGTISGGGNAPASLKHVHPPAIDLLRLGHFRGWKRPGLIEADSLRAMIACKCSYFRGWKRPGLIEAASRSLIFASRSDISGGGNAPASLKLLVKLSVPPRVKHISGGGNAPASLKPRLTCAAAACAGAYFRGWKRPGLIEASPRSPHPGSATEISGGGNAPASLKLMGWCESSPCQLSGFPGVETPRPH